MLNEHITLTSYGYRTEALARHSCVLRWVPQLAAGHHSKSKKRLKKGYSNLPLGLYRTVRLLDDPGSWLYKDNLY